MAEIGREEKRFFSGGLDPRGGGLRQVFGAPTEEETLQKGNQR
jgi:hypothetical protein